MLVQVKWSYTGGTVSSYTWGIFSIESSNHYEWRRDSEHHVDMESHCEHREDRDCTHYEHHVDMEYHCEHREGRECAHYEYHVELECVSWLFKPLNIIPRISIDIWIQRVWTYIQTNVKVQTYVMIYQYKGCEKK